MLCRLALWYTNTSGLDSSFIEKSNFCSINIDNYDFFKTFNDKHVAVLFRLALSILHFNENSNRQVRVTERGEATYVMKFPKYKQGGYIVRAARVKATYGMQNVMYSLQSVVM